MVSLVDQKIRAGAQDDRTICRNMAWRDGPREPLVQCIDTYLNTIVEMSEQSVDELRSQDGRGLNAS